MSERERAEFEAWANTLPATMQAGVTSSTLARMAWLARAALAASPSAPAQAAVAPAAQPADVEALRRDAEIVYATMCELQKRLEEETGVRHTWADVPIQIAERAAITAENYKTQPGSRPQRELAQEQPTAGTAESES